MPKENMNNRILIIGEAFGAEEEKQDKAFVGRSGQLLRRALEDAGYNLDLIDFNNVCMWRPAFNRPPTEAEIEAELPRLNRLLAAYITIFLMGNTAHKTLSPLSYKPLKEMVARPIGFNNTTFVTFYHPSYVLRGNYNYNEYIEDLKCGAISSTLSSTGS